MTLSTDLPSLLVDAHVHLHPCFDLTQFLQSALANFQHQSDKLGLSQPLTAALLLAEVNGVNAFADLVSRYKQDNPPADWEICPTAEAATLWFKHSSGHTLLIAAGRQAVTQEGIEVLALITAAAIEDRLSLEDTLAAVTAAGGLPVLPWGVGKWLGKRGQLVAAQLQAADGPLFAGDNGGRPSFWPLPDYCQQRLQLPGTDPLPLSYEVARAGSFGFVTQGHLDGDRPGESLKQILLGPQPVVQAYGQPQSPWHFLKNQSLLRLS